MKYTHLFQPLTAGPLRIRNRIVIPPLVLRHATEGGDVTSPAVAHYAGIKSAGLVVVEAAAVSPEGRLARNQIGIFEDRHLEGLTALAEAIHATGALAAIQIHHAGRNTTTDNTLGLPLVAPSPFSSKRASARALTEPEILGLEDAFVSAAKRARRAGFDAVEVHAAHGYLISQFLSPLANQRTDRWGGSLENRARFLRDVLSRIRTEGGPAAYCRLGAADGEPGGLTLEEGITVARWLADDGMPLVHVSSGMGSPPASVPAGGPWSDRLMLGARVKKESGLPVIGVGDIRSPDQAEAVLSEGLVDMTAIGRAILVDPLWIVKTMEDRPQDIRPCRGCTACHRFMHPERCPAGKEEASA